jgi:hypothetical protein
MSWLTFLVPLILLSFGFGLMAAAVVLPDRYTEVDSAFLEAGGTLVAGGFALAVVWLTLKLTPRNEARKKKRSLQVELGAAQEFPGIDLSNPDLSGFFLTGKNFTGAYFLEKISA